MVAQCALKRVCVLPLQSELIAEIDRLYVEQGAGQLIDGNADLETDLASGRSLFRDNELVAVGAHRKQTVRSLVLARSRRVRALWICPEIRLVCLVFLSSAGGSESRALGASQFPAICRPILRLRGRDLWPEVGDR